MNQFVEVHCYLCGVVFGIDAYLHGRRRADKKNFWCTNGHDQAYVESEADKLRRERDNLKQQQARLEDQISAERGAREAAERRASAARGQVTRLKNRASAGVCPCCNRTISQLAKHMQTKHPEFVAENVVHLAARTKESQP